MGTVAAVCNRRASHTAGKLRVKHDHIHMLTGSSCSWSLCCLCTVFPILASGLSLCSKKLCVQQMLLTLTSSMTCRRHLDELLEGLSNWTQDAASATAAKNTACLLQLTKAFAETQAAPVRQDLPPQFSNVVEDAGQQCTALCAGCACQQVQVIILRLATSDLFVEPPASASGTFLCLMLCVI